MSARRTKVAAVVAVLAFVGAVVLAAVGAHLEWGSDDEHVPSRSSPVDEPNERFFAHGGQFAVECGFSHAATIDPIVWPGRRDRSHRHDFFGATSVDARSTGSSLVGEPTTCRQRTDSAAYWAPSLYRDGEPVEPAGITAYYRVAPGVDPRDVVAYPLGLAAIAGDAAASSAQPTGVVAFACGRGGGVTSEFPRCREGAPLQLRVTFPHCWDGEHLDSKDHRSHLAYSGGRGCGDRHPVALPRLTLVVHYPVAGDPRGLELASGPAHTAHADFLNGWDEDALAHEVGSCLHTSVVCSIPDSARTAAK